MGQCLCCPWGCLDITEQGAECTRIRARSGVHTKVAQALARHSTITLTMDRYSHNLVEEQSAAVEALPDLLKAQFLTRARETGSTPLSTPCR
jgi:hypothetical protein